MDTNKQQKKPVFKRVWFWVLIVLVLITIGATSAPKETATKANDSNGSQTQSSGESSTVFKPGDTIEFDGKKVTVTSPERNWNSGNEYITPNSGNEFIKVQVAIENNSNNEASYNTFDWKMQDSKGVIKDVASVAFTVDGALSSGQLAPKGKVAGFLVFEVPNGDTGLTLRYSPSFWTNKNIEIKL